MAEDPISCPYCGCLAHKISITSEHAMVFERFTDELGREHFHDPNARRQKRHCRGCGGEFIVETMAPCPACNYGHTVPQIIKA